MFGAKNMISKDKLKSEIDKIDQRHHALIYRILRAFESEQQFSGEARSSWSEFVESTYGCLEDDHLKRGQQGDFELREGIE